MARTIAAENTINGGFGELVWRGVTMANVMSVEARATLNKRDIRIAGSRLTQYKAMDVRGEGSFTIYRVTSEFVETNFRKCFLVRDQEDLLVILRLIMVVLPDI